MREWHCIKYTNDGWVNKKWQIYYKEDDGRKRFFGEAFDYPTAAALVEALGDAEIRRFAAERYATDIMHVYEYTQANMATFKRIMDIAKKHDCEVLPTDLIAQVIECE